MNRTNYLLTVLGEEGAEVTQAASKSIRFGLNSEYTGTLNSDKIMMEFYDLVAVIEMLQKDGALPAWSEQMQNLQKGAKKIQVEKFMKL